MKKQEILICDTDSAFCEALVKYLMGSGIQAEIHMFTDPELFEYEDIYDVMLLTDEFIEALSDIGEEEKRKILRLCPDPGASGDGYEVFYKFQPMGTLISLLKEKGGGAASEGKRGRTYYGIYASYKSELLTPFALMLGKLLSEKEETLIIDMQENSYMSEFMGLSGKKTLTDALYLMESDETAALPVEAEGKLSVVPPVRSPMEISAITTEEWNLLMNRINDMGFTNGIFVFDSMHRGFADMMERMDRIYLISNGGVYYEKNDEKLLRLFRESGLSDKVERICLPVTMDQFRFDAYPVETLMEGSFGRYVRKRCQKAYGGV